MRFRAIINHAFEFAQTVHRGQSRKDALRTPFINHPLRVFSLIQSEGHVDDPEVLSAALLYDVLEDTSVDSKLLRQSFGTRIAELVEEVTDDPKLSPADRKASRVKKMPALSSEAALICLADKLVNIEDMIDSPPLGWTSEERIHYVRWARLLKRNRTSFPREYPGLSRLFEHTAGSAIVRIAHPELFAVDAAA